MAPTSNGADQAGAVGDALGRRTDDLSAVLGRWGARVGWADGVEAALTKFLQQAPAGDEALRVVKLVFPVVERLMGFDWEEQKSELRQRERVACRCCQVGAWPAPALCLRYRVSHYIAPRVGEGV